MRKRTEKRRPKADHPTTTYCAPRLRRNAWEPQVVVPHRVDLPLAKENAEEVAVPASINGRSLAGGRP